MEQEREAAIVVRIREGDRDAFSLLVDACKAPLFNLLFRMTGNREEADELAQETFVRAYEKLHKYQSDQRFFTWLYTIGLNVARNHLRRRALWGKLVIPGASDKEFQASAGGGQEQDLLAKEEQRRLQDALLKLPHDQREVIVLRYYQDLSFGDIARICKLTDSGVKMRLYRALERLRGLIDFESNSEH